MRASSNAFSLIHLSAYLPRSVITPVFNLPTALALPPGDSSRFFRITLLLVEISAQYSSALSRGWCLGTFRLATKSYVKKQ